MRHLFMPVLLALIICPGAANAQLQLDIGAGISFTRDNEDTPALALAWLPLWREVRGGLLRGEYGAMQLRGRDDSRYRNVQTVRIVHAGIRYERPGGLTIGFGLGAQHKKTDALSGDPQFISTIGWRWDRLSLLLRHISNGGFDKPNDGENVLQLAWRF